MADSVCDNCPHFWSQHDAWGCQAHECPCKRIDRDYWYNRNEKVPNLVYDLRTRWLPSAEQMALADALLLAGFDQERGTDRERGVYTTHLLIGKEYGFWTEDIKLVFLDGVFLTRQAALDFLHMVAEKRHNESGETLVGGWAWHPEPTVAAVWDDIMSQYPQKEK